MGLKIGLIKDESARWDGYNWHDEWGKYFLELGDSIEFLDFKRSDWREQVKEKKCDAYLWRAWHRPDDRDDAKNKIYFLDNVLGSRVFPSWDMYWPYDNKVAQLDLMKELGIPHPRTFFSRDRIEIANFVKSTALPVVSKCSEGACSDNVRKIDTREELETHVEELFSDQGVKTYFPWIRQRGYVYFQEWLPINGRDMRIITLGDKAIYACWFTSSDWKRFGEEVSISFDGIPDEAKRLCEEATKKLSHHWSAFDVAEVDGRFYILEFSSIFGFSFPKPLMERFGSPNAHILKHQAEYIHNLLEKNE